MLLTDFMKLNSKLTVPYIQKAYRFVVRKLRLDPVLLPVLLTGRVNFNSFDSPFKDKNLSEYVVKEVDSILNGLLSESPAHRDYIDCTVGTIGVTNYDLTFTDNTTVSNEEFSIEQETLECVTSDDTVALLSCYVYPYFVRPTIGQASDRISYDIHDMIVTYGLENLSVDNGLMMFIGPMALSYYNDDKLNIALAKTLEYYTLQLINLYNSYTQTFSPEKFDGKRKMTYGSI